MYDNFILNTMSSQKFSLHSFGSSETIGNYFSFVRKFEFETISGFAKKIKAIHGFVEKRTGASITPSLGSIVYIKLSLSESTGQRITSVNDVLIIIRDIL